MRANTAVAVIGCGHWGPNHMRVLRGLLPGGSVMAIDQDEDRLAQVRKQFADTRVSKDPGAAFEDPAIDAVFVCTPAATHYRLVKGALAAGKHVLCEKPLTLTAIEAEELTCLARKAGKVLMVGHIFLFNGGVGKLKELCRADATGRLLYMTAVRTNLGPIRSDCNVSYDLASHDIAIFNWILDSEPELVTASGHTYISGREDVAFLTMRYPDGAVGHIHSSWVDPKKVRQITAVGSKRMMTWDDLNPTFPIAVYDSGAEMKSYPTDYGEFSRATMWDGAVVLPKVQQEEPLKVQDRSFLEAIEGRVKVVSDGSFATGVVRVLEAAQESLRLNGAPVRVSPRSPA